MHMEFARRANLVKKITTILIERKHTSIIYPGRRKIIC